MENNNSYNLLKQKVLLAENGDKEALHWLWLQLDKGIDIYNSREFEYRWYYVMATKYKDTQAMMALYEMYLNGIYVNKDKEEALKWLNNAASLKDTAALKEKINYDYSHNYLDSIIVNFDSLLRIYLDELSIEEAIDNIFDEMKEDCVDYIKRNYNFNNVKKRK